MRLSFGFCLQTEKTKEANQSALATAAPCQALDVGGTRMTTKQEIELALKKTLIPILRDMGFKGSLPNFRRIDEGFISLINFQFYSSGGSFCVNLSYAGPNRENVGHCPPAELNNLTVSHTRDRIRLGETQGDNWFSFGTTNYGECRGTPEPLSQIITTIGQLLRDQAEPWWKAKKKDFNNSQP